MSKSSPSRRTNRSEQALVNFAASQSIKGHSLAFDDYQATHITEERMVPRTTEKEAYRQIDGRSVSHVAENSLPFKEPDFAVRKLHRWGQLDHPSIVLASYEISGDVRFYVDTRVPGFYLLWTATRVDGDEFPGVSHDVVAWMPRVKGDAVTDAGFRLAHAAMLEMLLVSKDEWHCEPCMAGEMRGSKEVAMIIGTIAPTIHKSDRELRRRLAAMPEYLRPLYEAGATVGKVECTYNENKF